MFVMILVVQVNIGIKRPKKMVPIGLQCKLATQHVEHLCSYAIFSGAVAAKYCRDLSENIPLVFESFHIANEHTLKEMKEACPPQQGGISRDTLITTHHVLNARWQH
jgi:hypothetical protein